MTNSKNLTIVFITNNWFPFGAGVVSSINAFRKELQRQGHAVTVITLDFKGSLPQEEGVIRIKCPIRFLYRGIPMAVPWRADKQVRDLIKQLSPDIIHIHHPFLLGVSGLRAAKLYTIPCIFTYHSLYEKYTHYVPLPQTLVRPVVRQMVRRFCALVSGIITPGKETERLLERDGITTPHLLLPSPVQQIFVDALGKKKLREGIPTFLQNPFHLMTCSRFVKEKNIPFLLSMFAGLDQTKYRLTLAGFGTELDTLKQYAYETLKLSPDVVQFAVKLSAEELCALYADCDLFVFASLADTQGLVLAEAMTNGLPVVALHGPGQEDIVVNGENGYLVSSMEDMRFAIQMIAGDFTLYKNLHHGAVKTAKRYWPTSLTEQLVAFYYSLIHK